MTPCCNVLDADAVLSNIIPIVLDSGNRERIGPLMSFAL